MFLYFDKEGTLKTKIDHGEKIRQGSDLNITVCLDTDFWSDKHWGDYASELNMLQMSLVFPNDQQGASRAPSTVEERTFEKLYDSEIVYNLVPGNTYIMYDFHFDAADATAFFGKLEINVVAGNNMSTDEYVKFGTTAEWTETDPVLESGEIGIRQYGSDFYMKYGNGVQRFSDITFETPIQSGKGNPTEDTPTAIYWYVNTDDYSVWHYEAAHWVSLLVFKCDDTIRNGQFAFATTEAYIEKTIGFAKAQIDQKIAIKYQDIMNMFKDVYSKLAIASIKPNWNQNASGDPSFIFNKPNIINTTANDIDNLGNVTGIYFVKNEDDKPVTGDYILFQYFEDSFLSQIVWRDVSTSYGRLLSASGSWTEWQKSSVNGALTGTVNPSDDLVVGVLGQLYLNTETDELFYCIDDTSPYKWVALSKVISSITTNEAQARYNENQGIFIDSQETFCYADGRLNQVNAYWKFPIKAGKGIGIKQSAADEKILEVYTDLEAKLNENIEKNPSKTYLVWKGNQFPNSTDGKFKAPAGSTIDWGDGVVETFETASTDVNTHTYTDGYDYHLITINGLTSLDDNVFRNCTSLTSITISDSVTSIGIQVFKGCNSLTSIVIPGSITSIGNSAFIECYKLTSITVKSITPPTLSSNAIPTTIEKIIVPKSAISAYKASSGWSTYADKIVYEVDSSDLDNYVPTQSESADKYYAQITNENGIISARIFQNGGEDIQNLTIDKNGVKVLGKNIATTDDLDTKVSIDSIITEEQINNLF